MDKRMQFLKEMQAKGYDLRIPDAHKNSLRISTGVVALDYVMDGGLAKGHRLELWGENQGGKSLLTLKIIAEFQKLDKICVLIDSENSFDAGWATALDVDPEKLLISEPETLEEAGDMMVDMMQKGVDLIVVDSIINLINQAELERDTDEPTRGGNAKVNSLITKKLSAHSAKHPTCFVFVNQVRIDMNKTFGNPRDTAGGKALKHFYDTRVQVIPASKIQEGDEIIGKNIILDCIKNKKGVPRRVANFDFYHDGSINNNATLLNMAVKYGIIEKGGSWYTYGDLKAQGEPKFGQALTDANLWDEITEKVWKNVNPRLEHVKPVSQVLEKVNKEHKETLEKLADSEAEEKLTEAEKKADVGKVDKKKRGRPKKKG